MIRKGERNLITDVAGLRVGQAEDALARTGVTVLVGDEPMMVAADTRGGGVETRNVQGLDSVPLVDTVDAVVLSGGSAFGLDAPSGVQAWLKEVGRGFRIAPGLPPVPIVSGAILFDLANGGDKQWGDAPPYRALGRRAAESAGADFALGNAGAGLGALAGVYKGGIGSASSAGDDATVGALVAVNSVGSPLIPGTGIFWAWPFEQDGEFGGRAPRDAVRAGLDLPADMKGAVRPAANTTIAAVATDVELTTLELRRVAIMAADGFARALRPVHSPFDGDLVTVVSTARRKLAEPRALAVLRLGHMAADCLARAIARGVYEAQSLGSFRSYRDTFP